MSKVNERIPLSDYVHIYFMYDYIVEKSIKTLSGACLLCLVIITETSCCNKSNIWEYLKTVYSQENIILRKYECYIHIWL